MWLPVAAGGKKEITSAPPHAGDAKGGGKKGITSVKILQGALDREDSASHMKKQEREPAKSTIAMVI